MTLAFNQSGFPTAVPILDTREVHKVRLVCNSRELRLHMVNDDSKEELAFDIHRQ